MGILSKFFAGFKVATPADIIGGQQLPFDVVMPGQSGCEKYQKKLSVEQYKQWVYSAANKNARSIASARLRLYAARQTGQMKARVKAGAISASRFRELKAQSLSPAIAGAVEVEEIFAHPVLDLINNVNAHANRFDTFEILSLYLDLTGDGYWYIRDNAMGIPESIQTLPSQWTTVVPAKDSGFVAGFLFGRNPSKQIPLDVDEVIWFQLPNPADPYHGKSRVEAAWDSIDGYDARGKYETQLLKNNGIPPTMINYSDGELTKPQSSDLQTRFNNLIGSVAKRGRSFVTDNAITTSDISVSPRDIAILRAREWRRDEIITAFGQTLSLYDPKANRANIEGAIFLWQNDEITPSLKRIEQKLNEQLLPRYNEPRLFFAFDSIVQKDQAQELSNDDVWLRNGMPLNQILRRRGMQEVEGGDVGYVSNSVVPLGSVEQADEKQIQTKDKKSVADDNRSITLSSGGSLSIGGLKIEPVDRELTGGANNKLTNTEQEIADGVGKTFRKQAPIAVAEAAKEVGADFAWVASESWADEIADLTSGAIGVEIRTGAGKGARKIGVTVTDYIDQPAVTAAAKSEAYKFATALGKSSQSKLQAAMAKGLEIGESIPELQDRIKGIFKGWENWRVERVARTEATRAQMTGTEKVWQESGVVASKQWDANGDACPFCLDMDGKTVELGVPYWTTDEPNQVVEFEGKDITLKHEYENVGYPPLHPNCRCSLQPVLIEV